MGNPHAFAIAHSIRQMMLIRKMAIEMNDMTAEEVDAFINAEGEKWMLKTNDMNALECMFELAKLLYELEEAAKEEKESM